jgi:hypothetical protein
MDFRQSATLGILAHENYAQQKFRLYFADDAAHVHHTDHTFYGAHKFRGKIKIP